MQQIAQCTIRLRIILAVLAILGSFAIPARQARSSQPNPFTVLHYFAPAPEGVGGTSLMRGNDGNFYGTSFLGGAYLGGVVFKVTPDGVFTVLHSFNGIEGSFVNPSLFQGPDGSLYGTTAHGGANDAGIVFRLLPDGTLITVYSFSNSAGAPQFEGLILASDGNLYGAGGFVSGGPAIFRLTLGGEVTAMHTLDAATPQCGGLIQATDGNIYGVAFHLDYISPPYGSAFRMTLDGTLTIIHNFTSSDVSPPLGPLTQGADGALYGVGGSKFFRLTFMGVLTILADFPSGYGQYYFPSDNREIAGVSQGADGKFYGVAYGAISAIMYSVTPSGTLNIIHTFAPGDIRPIATAVGIDGNIYGVSHGVSPVGTRKDLSTGAVLRITPTGVLTTIHTFVESAEGSAPAALAQALDGTLYGMAYLPGNDLVAVLYRLNQGGAETVLHTFAQSEGNLPAGLVQGRDGKVYGTTGLEMFSVDGAATNPFSIIGTAGYPRHLIRALDGNFYGTTDGLSLNEGAMIVRVTPDGAATPFYTFPGGSDNSYLDGDLIQGADGNFFGSTTKFNSDRVATIFRLAPNGVFRTVHVFTPSEGRLASNVVQLPDGNLYGATAGGGAFGLGSLFRLSMDGTLTTLHSFTSGPDAALPDSLCLGMDGNLYGVTGRSMYYRSVAHAGIYRLTRAGGYRHLCTIDSRINIDDPFSVFQAIDGNLYGMAYANNTYVDYLYGGGIFKFSLSGIRTLSDFNHDGMSDLILQSPRGNEVDVWSMVGPKATESAPVIRTLAPGVTVAGAGFFDGGGEPDLVLQNETTHQIEIWYMDHHIVTGKAIVSKRLPSGWTIAAIGDFNNDGVSDLVVQNSYTRQVEIWYMDNAAVASTSALSQTLPRGWTIAGAGDFNGNGVTDLVLQNEQIHKIALWHLNGATVTGGDYVSLALPIDWSVVAVADTDGDNVAELVLQNKDTSRLAIWTMHGPVVTGGAYVDHVPLQGWTIAGPR